MNFDAFLDTYVRINDGTTIVICSHLKCARATALLFVACVHRHAYPDVVQFLYDDNDTQKQVMQALNAAHAKPQTRRVAVIVVEPEGYSFSSVLEKNPSQPHIFRVTAESIMGTSND